MIKKEEILKTLEEKYIGMNWNDVDYDEIKAENERLKKQLVKQA